MGCSLWTFWRAGRTADQLLERSKTRGDPRICSAARTGVACAFGAVLQPGSFDKRLITPQAGNL